MPSPIYTSLIMMYNKNMRNLKKKPIQIYVEVRQEHLLEVLSKKRGVSKAEIVRESLERYLHELPLEEDPATGIVGLGNSGKGDLSENHDKYLAEHAASKSRNEV